MNKWVMAAVVVSLFAWGRVEADTIIVDNLLPDTANSANNTSVSGVKNGLQDAPYAQAFETTVSGNLNSLVFDLGLQSTTGTSSGSPYLSNQTLSIYLYTSNSNGGLGTEVATLATGITTSEIDNSANYLGYTQNNDSFIYQYSLTSSLLSHPTITANEDYAIVFSLSGSTQDIGWAEENGSDAEPKGEVSKLHPPGGYGRMELNITSPAPEPSTGALMLGGLGLLAFWHARVRRAGI